MGTPEDRSGLDRSVLTYVDVSVQPKSRFYLIIDESYGKALFTVDQVEVNQQSIIAYRDNPTIEKVVEFSPQLPWRIVNTKDVYIQDTRTVMERDGAEAKDLRDFRTKLLKELGLEGPSLGGLPDGIVTGATPGQYL